MRFLTATTLSILIVAILLGLVAAYGVRMLLREPPAVRERPEPVINIPMAAVDLPAGRTVRLGDVALMPMTRADLANKGLLDILSNSEQVLGRTLKREMPRGEAFRPPDFYLEGQGPTFLSELPEGYRAVTVTVPKSRGGYAAPGNYVDVVFRAAPVQGTDTTPTIPDTTITLIENAKVLAVESDLPKVGSADPVPSGNLDLRNREARRQEPPATIILAATPKQANALSAVLDRGEISLVTRPTGEAGYEVRPPATSLEDILGLEPPVPYAPPPPFVTEIYRKGNMTANAFAVDEAGRTVPLHHLRQPAAHTAP